MNRKKPAHDSIRIKGMFHLQIEEDGKIVGDSGWLSNKITNAGYLNLVNLLGTGLTGSQIQAAALGTGGVPAGGDTTQSGEVVSNAAGSVKRAYLSATSAVSNTSTGLQNTATFSSANSFASTSYSISNIGLWSATGPATNNGTFLAGNTYASSQLATNQNVNITYSIYFG